MESASGNEAPGTELQPTPRRKPVTLRRRITRLLLLTFGIYLAFCAALAWETVRPKNHALDSNPDTLKLMWNAVKFTSSDGTQLAGWFITPFMTKDAGPKGVVILCHGVDSTRTAMLGKAEILAKAGYAALLFDFRGRGESGPSLCTIGYREVDDLLAAIAYVKSRPDCNRLPLGVLGESQGGAVALMGTARSHDVKAVIAESPFARLDHAVSNHFHKAFGWSAPIVAFPVQLMGEAIIRRRCCNISPVDEVSKIAPRPILLIQDEDDALCPPEETRELLKSAGGNASLWSVPGADHIQAEYVASDEFKKRVTTFFDKYLN
jgi:fermentation-respiration switch protein FrsA (DUF1100 family)